MLGGGRSGWDKATGRMGRDLIRLPSLPASLFSLLSRSNLLHTIATSDYFYSQNVHLCGVWGHACLLCFCSVSFVLF